VDMTPASPFDSVTGLYYARRQLTAAAGFENNKTYVVVVKATVDSVSALDVHVFQVRPLRTGDSYAIVNHADYGNAKLVRSTTPANTLTVDANHLVAVPATQKVDVDTIKTQAVTCAAGVTVLASVGTAATSTAQTGDSYAIVNGDHGLVSIQDDVDAIKLQTDKLTFEAVTNHIEAAVQNIAADAIDATAIKNGAIDANTFAAGALDAVWSTAARTLTAIDEDSTTLDLDATIATAVWNAATSGYGGAGTYGQAVEDILADTNELQVDDYPTSIAAIKTVVDVIQADTDLLDDEAGGLADIHTDIGTLQAAVDGITAAVITNAAGADVAADIIAAKAVVDLVEDIVRNKMVITDANGNTVLYADDSVTPLYSVNGCVTDDSTTTTRLRLA